MSFKPLTTNEAIEAFVDVFGVFCFIPRTRQARCAYAHELLCELQPQIADGEAWQAFAARIPGFTAMAEEDLRQDIVGLDLAQAN